MRRILFAAIAGSLVLLPAAGQAKPKTLDNVRLAYTPTTTLGDKDPIDLSGAFKVKIRVGPFTDARAQTDRIGENREDADKGRIRPVTTRDDVAAWVRARVADELGRYGLTVVEQGEDVLLTGDIRRFFVTEDSTYESDVGILISLYDESAKELWQGMANGTATRWGRSYKLENYEESWSDGLFEAIYSLVSSGEFRSALRER